MDKTTEIERRNRKKKILLNVFLSITILSIISVIIFKSDIFKIENIVVYGNSKIDENEIIEYSKINIGENIFRLNKVDVKERLEELAYIKEVDIKRNLPDNININIIEKEEKALIKSISTYQIIDMDGYVLNETDEINENLPILLGLNIYDININDNLFDAISDEYIVELFREGDRLELLDKIKSINLEFRNDIHILLKDDIDIAFGNLDNVEYKLQLLNKVLQDIEEKEISVKEIIMNKGDHPIIIRKD